MERRQHERRTKIDIVFEKVVIHVDAEIKGCPVCHEYTKGAFPEDMAGTIQYGAGVKAFILNLLVGQMMTLNRIQKLIKTLMGVVISEATTLNYTMQLYFALEQREASSNEQMPKAATVHTDETFLRVNKRNHWIHVYSSGEVTLKFLHGKRGTEAIAAIHIIP